MYNYLGKGGKREYNSSGSQNVRGPRSCPIMLIKARRTSCFEISYFKKIFFEKGLQGFESGCKYGAEERVSKDVVGKRGLSFI